MHFPNIDTKSIPVLMVAMLGMLAASEPASANTYIFTIPTGLQGSAAPNTILGALDIAVQLGAGPTDPFLFGFYDFSILPQLTNYSIGTATAPVPGCVSPITAPCNSTYTATPNVAGTSAHFTFDAADNTIAIVSNNPAAGNKSYPNGPTNPFPTGATTEIMPSGAAFSFTLTTSDFFSFQTPAITFQISGIAVRYLNTSATTLLVKSQAFIGSFDAVGTAPEPSTMFFAGGGLCLAFLHRLRRKLKR